MSRRAGADEEEGRRRALWHLRHDTLRHSGLSQRNRRSSGFSTRHAYGQNLRARGRPDQHLLSDSDKKEARERDARALLEALDAVKRLVEVFLLGERRKGLDHLGREER